MGVIVECEHLSRSYGDLIAVNDVSFRVEEGEIFGLVGPNGAGKTTLIEMIEGLRTPDSGLIKALGLDPIKEDDELKERIGVLLQTPYRIGISRLNIMTVCYFSISPLNKRSFYYIRGSNCILPWVS